MAGFRRTPPDTTKQPVTSVLAGQRLFVLWWQVKDSNLRSFRDGFTDRRSQDCDLRQHRGPENLATNRPQTPDASRSPPDTFGQPNHLASRPSRPTAIPHSRRGPLPEPSPPRVLVGQRRAPPTARAAIPATHPL